MFNKVLVANRGEIALRVINTLNVLGISSVAVYSEADQHAPHVQAADEAILLGPGPSSSSYLLGDKIIAEAKARGVDGIHPGYGFLSENAEFAQAVTDAGMKFIGPSPHAIRIMGSKLDAKAAVKGYDIPMVPGLDRALTGPEEALKLAKEIGYPVLIKASAGGGGKGMRVVEKAEDLKDQMERAISEARSSFGDDSVFIEKYVASPRHIEIQVLADQLGNTIHVFERECSVQRRHQKVVEEAPSAVLDEATRNAMGEAAVKVAKACQYEGAGTVEFLLDENMNFYFLEMNTRLQVEHPVTELISGLDLVHLQLEIAAGLPLSIQQKDLSISGHAMELRVYAENPADNFLPSVGQLEKYKRPTGANVRVDDGYNEGMEIPIFYDPMIGKLITYGKDRTEAISRMIKAIEDFEIEGIYTTLPFGKFVMEHPAFVAGNFDTHFVKKYYSPSALVEQQTKGAKTAAALAQVLYQKNKKQLTTRQDQNQNWRWRSNND